MTPEQLETLRAGLPPFVEGTQPSALLAQYCRAYHLDFSAPCPEVEHSCGTVASGEFMLATHLWRQPGASANLFLVHGYFDHSGLFSKLVNWGLSHNCNVLIFDLPGHGLSTGEPAAIDDFSDYSQAIFDVLDAIELPSLPLCGMAQSTGCAALVDFASKFPWPFEATVLLAPLVRPAQWHSVWLAHVFLGKILHSVPRRFAVNTSDGEFLSVLKADPLQSRRISLRWVAALRRWLRRLEHQDLGVGAALIVQGDEDDTVDWRYNIDVVCTLFPGSRVEYLSGAGHQLANEASELQGMFLKQVEAWLIKCGITLKDSDVVPGRLQ